MKTTTGSTVQRIRDRHHLSAPDLASILHVTRKTVNMWCKTENEIGGTAGVLLALMDEQPQIAEQLAREAGVNFVTVDESDEEKLRQAAEVVKRKNSSFLETLVKLAKADDKFGTEVEL